MIHGEIREFPDHRGFVNKFATDFLMIYLTTNMHTVCARIAKLVLFTFLFLFIRVASTLAQERLSKGEHFAEVNGIRIHYYVRGKGPVCLLPSAGWGIPVQYIMPLRIFEKHFTMIYYDTRLTGKSGGPADSLKYRADDFMQDMDSLRAYLQQPKIWLAGHSMGGFQVLNYATQHNDKLYGLIVMSSIIKLDSVRSAHKSKLLDQRKNYPYYLMHPVQYKKAIAVQRGEGEGQYTLRQIFDFTGGLYCHNPEVGYKYFSRLNFRDTVDRFIDKSGFYEKHVFSSIYKITVPTFVICGDDDFICDHVSQSDRIHAQIASSKLIILKNCGHMLWVEQPKAFNAAFEVWFKEQHL
jgi:proline iminopeptidase